MSQEKQARPHDRWAHLRFSIVGPLLAAPPAQGALKTELERLSEKEWLHPISQQPVHFALSTIERWYYAARGAKDDPVGILRRAVRKDIGQHPSLDEHLRRIINAQYQTHKQWSYLLHFDNLRARAQIDPSLPTVPSYSSVMRYMKDLGLIRRPLPRGKRTPGMLKAEARLESREVRSYESEYVNAL